MLWKIAVQAAVMERKQEQLQERVWEAEAALFERWQQLPKSEFFEDLELRKAAKILLEIQGERLGYPQVRPESIELGHILGSKGNVLHTH